MATSFSAGDKVKVRNMTMPGTIVSGPHKSPGHDRYLVRKADGNVSLIKFTELDRVVPRLDQMAGTLAIVLYGRSFVTLDFATRTKVAAVARRVLALADSTRDMG